MPLSNYYGTLESRIIALEMALERLTGLSANTVIGSLSGGNAQSIPFTSLPAFTGASAGAAGQRGLVPSPGAGKQGSFLAGDGTWRNDIPGRFGQLDGHGAWPNENDLSAPFGWRFCVSNQSHILKVGIGSEYPAYFLEIKIGRFTNDVYP